MIRAGHSSAAGCAATGWRSLLLSASFAVCVGAQALPAPVGLTSNATESPSKDGNVQLSWTVAPELDVAFEAGELAFTIEERSGDDVVEIDAGPFASSALSGRDDGAYRYRVRVRRKDGAEVASAWSEPVDARVEHHSLWLALTAFLIGAVVFVSTACLLLIGHRRSRVADPDPA